MHASTGKGSKVKYSRVLFKISGEALMGSRPFGHDMEVIDQLCKDISDIYKLGVQVCIVVGGGNIFRGAYASLSGCERASSDYIGMLATIILLVDVVHRGAEPSAHHDVQRPQAEDVILVPRHWDPENLILNEYIK